MNTLNFKVKELTCEACIKLASNRIKKIPGVENVEIDLETGNAKVTSVADFDIGVVRQSLVGTNYKIVD